MESFIGRSFDVTALKEQNRRKMIFAGTVVLCVLICGIIFYLGFHWFVNRQFHSVEIVDTIAGKEGDTVSYQVYEDGIIKYTRDGVSALDGKGNTIWSGSYDMTNPKVSTCGSYAVVADIGGKSLCVYNGEDTGMEITVDYDIVQASISNQGVVAVLTEEAASNTISLYNPYNRTDRLLAEIPTNVEDGYPVSMAISPDGSSVVATYLCVTTGAAQSRVAFYNFTSVGKNANCLVGAHNYNDCIVSEVRFLDDSHVCLFSESGFFVWENMKQPKQIAKKKIDRDIRSAFCNSDTIGIITKENDDSAKMKLFALNGREKLECTVKNTYTDVQMQGDEIILNASGFCQIYRTNGVKKLDCTFDNKISYFFPGTKRNRYYIVQNTKLRIVKLK